MSTESSNAPNGDLLDEHTPLLPDVTRTHDASSEGQRSDEAANEPSNRELATIMSSVWVSIPPKLFDK
jgi:hypothetical protein